MKNEKVNDLKNKSKKLIDNIKQEAQEKMNKLKNNKNAADKGTVK